MCECCRILEHTCIYNLGTWLGIFQIPVQFSVALWLRVGQWDVGRNGTPSRPSPHVWSCLVWSSVSFPNQLQEKEGLRERRSYKKEGVRVPTLLAGGEPIRSIHIALHCKGEINFFFYILAKCIFSLLSERGEERERTSMGERNINGRGKHRFVES